MEKEIKGLFQLPKTHRIHWAIRNLPSFNKPLEIKTVTNSKSQKLHEVCPAQLQQCREATCTDQMGTYFSSQSVLTNTN